LGAYASPDHMDHDDSLVDASIESLDRLIKYHTINDFIYI